MRVAAALLALCVATKPALADPNVPVPDTFRMDDYRAPVPDTVPGAEVLSTAAIQDLVAQRSATLVDVLPALRRPEAMRPGMPWLPKRHASLPGSLWWPEIGRGAIPPAMEIRLRARLHDITAGEPNRLIVFFCLADCWMSWNAARRVAAMGFRAGWYPEGVDGWLAAGLPTQDILPETDE